MTLHSRVGGSAASVTSRRVRTAGSAVTAAAVYQRIAGAAVRVDAPPVTTPVFVEMQGNRGFATTNTVPALNAVQAGDVLLAFAGGNDQTTTLTPPAGLTWTQIGDAAGSNVRARLLVAVATGPVEAGTWTWSGSHNHSVAVGAWRNVAAPTAAGSATSSGTQVTTLDAPTRTTVGANALLVGYGFHPSAAGTSRGFPGSMTVRRDDGASTAGHVIAEEARPTPGATGTRTYTIVPGAAVLRAISVVLEPI